MIKNIFKGKVYKDQRGLITDVFYNKNINHVAYITTKKNGVRGNHYHKKTVQYTLVLEGKIRYFSKKRNLKKVKKRNLIRGDLIKSNPNEIHAFRTISDKSVMLALSSGLRGGIDYEKDTFRVTPITNK